jgi:integrase/recombinase XerC
MVNSLVTKTENKPADIIKTLTWKDLKGAADKIVDLLDVSETTRADYKYRIPFFLNFVKEQGYHFNSFLDFKRYLTERSDLSVATKNKYLVTAKIFLKELNRQGVLPADITQNVKAFSQNKKHKRDGLNDQEIARLAEKMRQLPTTTQNTRLRAFVSLLALQGLRQVEIIRLDVKDLDLVSNTTFVQGKGRDDKELVSLHPETTKALKEYLKTNKIADGPLFPSRSNNHRNQRLTTRAVRGIVKEFLNELGIEKTTHGFRHYFTTKLIKTYKGDLLEVAQYTRHKGLEMLQVYNDNVKKEADLPRFYKAFKGVSF